MTCCSVRVLVKCGKRCALDSFEWLGKEGGKMTLQTGFASVCVLCTRIETGLCADGLVYRSGEGGTL
eukprot:2183004-Pleurochrysis_carterae.AAC.1